MLVLTRLVNHAAKHYDFVQAFIIGPQGAGKTTYAMLVLYELYGDWDEVLKWVVFDPREVLPAFKEVLRGQRPRIKAVVFDDAGYHLSKYLFLQGREGAEKTLLINALVNLARTLSAAFIFTSPDLDTLKEIRKKSWIVGQPTAPSGWHQPYRVMKLYRKTIMPDGTTRIKHFAEDRYDLRAIPADVRREYEEKRRAAMEPLLEQLESLLSKGPGEDGAEPDEEAPLVEPL